MSAKFKLPRRIEMRDAVYSLAYVPGEENYIEPNFAAMQPTAADCTLVSMGGQKKWMTWVMMDAPARPGTATPPRRFLLFRLYDQPIQPMPAMFSDMIAYVCSPIEQGASPAQQFLNALVGRCEEEQAASVPRDDWAQKTFIVAEEDEESTTKTDSTSSEQRGPHRGPMQPKTLIAPNTKGDEE